MKNFTQKFIWSLLLLASFSIFAQNGITEEMFQTSLNTGANMTIGISSPDISQFAGGYIGAFYDLDADGSLEPVGNVEITDGFFALALWGDDASSPEKDGLNPGETPIFAILDLNGGVNLMEVFPDFPGYVSNGIVMVTGAIFDVPGCTSLLYLEYNPGANIDDGSCITPVVSGCTNPEACNYYAPANSDDSSCETPVQFYDCDGNCINDEDGDQICDENEVPGCQDPSFIEFNALAGYDDGSCVTTWEQAYYNLEGEISVLTDSISYLNDNIMVLDELWFESATLNSILESTIINLEADTAMLRSTILNLQNGNDLLASELSDVSYQLDTMTSAYLTLLESPQCEEIVINFEVGWNLFGYTSSQINQDIGDIIGSFDDKIYIIKDVDGEQYWPQFNYNGIGDFIPGQGYQLKATESFSISFEN